MSPERSFFDGLAEIREILETHASEPTALSELHHLLKDPDLRREFFGGLTGSNWILPLRDEGYFGTPPEPTEAAGGGFQHPRWPEGQYLVRMAPEAPDEVVAVFNEVPTTNLSVVGNILDAALAMPPASAKRLLPQIANAAETGTLWIHFKDASDLCVRLCEGDETMAGLELADTLFAPRPGEAEDTLSRRDAYWYKDGLKKIVPALVSIRPLEAVAATCRWLERVIDTKESADRDSGDDGSYWWRPAVEEHEQNHDSDVAGVLVGSARQAAEETIQRDKTLFGEVMAILSAPPYVIFKRIHIHLVGEFAELAPETACQLMMSRELFGDFRYKHEYAVLVGTRLGLLSEAQRDEWFSWVAAGPDMADYDDYFRSANGRDPTEDEREARRDYWRFKKLHCVLQHLDEDQRVFYDAMLATHGEPELADLNSRVSGGWVGSESPLSLEELSALSFAIAVQRVVAWKPTGDSFRGPSLEGLASVFGEYVGGSPTTFSGEARKLEGAPPIYVRTFLSQMTAAVKADQEVDVDEVLTLCEWVVHRPLDQIDKQSGTEISVDRSWQWTRDEISRFVVAVCQAQVQKQSGPAWEMLRGRMWGIIENLSSDSDQSNLLSDPAEVDPLTHDHLTEAINSPRGRALEAALEYARWVANSLSEPGDTRSVVAGGFDVMPEVRDLLDRTISAKSRSAAAHAIIGSRLGLLYWIDEGWLASHAKQLFFLKGIERDPPIVEGWAAWNAFLVWVRPHVAFYRMFRDEYAYAVRRSATAETREPSPQNPVARLGEHLMVLYGRGELPLDVESGLLRLFLSEARPQYRQHAMTFIGRVLETEKDLPNSFVDRYRALWEEYWRVAGQLDASGEPDALPFGHWLASGRFDPAWGIAQLEAFVETQPLPQPDGLVLKYLASVAPVNPLSAVAILDAMAAADQEGWRLGMRLDSVRTVLDTGLRGGGQARERARAVIDLLGRRGFTDIGTLLDAS